MEIKNLYLTNFRNYKKREFAFSPQANLVVGPNTSGKTNLLEAIFLLSFGSSPRATLDREMIRQPPEASLAKGGGVEFASVLGRTERDAARELEVQLIASKSSPTLTTKKFKINGVAKRLSDFLPEFHIVLFSPEDLNLVIGNPELRRRFLDFALANIDPRYRRAAIEYEKVRKRRNRLLERVNAGDAKESELAFWDAKLLEFGIFLQDERKKFFDEINGLLHISGFALHYLISGLTAERLREFRSREIAAETTLIGPHRDDFAFAIAQWRSEVRDQRLGNWRDLAALGSRSEQRRAVLALKKAELEFAEKKIGDRPILLLDDIFSELDEENRTRVSNFLNEGQARLDSASVRQVIITTADTHCIPKKLQKDLQIIKL